MNTVTVRLSSQFQISKPAMHHATKYAATISKRNIKDCKRFLRAYSTPEAYEWNRKLGSFVRAGKVGDARNMFDFMPNKDVVSWNTMIAAYFEANDIEESERLFGSMPKRSVVSWNCMVSGYMDHGWVDEALGLFLVMPKRNISSWNAMVSGMAKHDRFDEAERFFNEMPERNVISYTAMVDGLARRGDIHRARQLFDSMSSKNIVSWATMISGYVQNGMIVEARKLFDNMPKKSAVAFTVMIMGYCKLGDVDSAITLFHQLRQKDIVAWNVMIAGYTHNTLDEEALKLHKRMVILGTKPDHTTIIVVLTACSTLTSLQTGRQIHCIAVRRGLDSLTTLSNALTSMYSKCGSIVESVGVFLHTELPDLVSWNTIIAVHAQHGFFEKALEKFHELLKQGLKPDGVTFLSILSACGHAGMVDESLAWFDLMVDDYKIPPKAEHLACLADILGRAGRLEKAYHLITTIPRQLNLDVDVEFDSGVWGALLAACRVYRNVELGELAAKKMLALDPTNSGIYVMLSNIYAAAGMWWEVTAVRSAMKEQGVRKQTGCSWTEIGDTLHMFTGGDVLHPDICKIHSEIKRISFHMQDSFKDL